MTNKRTFKTSQLKFSINQIDCWSSFFWSDWNRAWYVHEATTDSYLCCKRGTGNVFLSNDTRVTPRISTTDGYFRTRAEAREVIKLAYLQTTILRK